VRTPVARAYKRMIIPFESVIKVFYLHKIRTNRKKGNRTIEKAVVCRHL